jgi:hypothetical protein
LRESFSDKYEVSEDLSRDYMASTSQVYIDYKAFCDNYNTKEFGRITFTKRINEKFNSKIEQFRRDGHKLRFFHNIRDKRINASMFSDTPPF